MRWLLLTLAFAVTGTTTPVAAGGELTVLSAGQYPSSAAGRLSDALRQLDFMLGPWAMTRYAWDRDGAWAEQETQLIVVDRSMNDLYLTTTIVTAGYTFELVFSYDTAMQTYRIVSRDDQSGLIDVYQGAFGPDGTLVVTNLESGTHFLSGELRIHNRLTFTPKAEGWSVMVEASADHGAHWSPQVRLEALRS